MNVLLVIAAVLVLIGMIIMLIMASVLARLLVEFNAAARALAVTLIGHRMELERMRALAESTAAAETDNRKEHDRQRRMKPYPLATWRH